jgi:hypothetical protein
MEVKEDNHAIDQLIRQTRAHHVQLSAMADMKANMLLTVSMLVITFTAPHVLDEALQIPAAIVCVSSLATVILAAYAVMPKLMLPGNSPAAPDPTSNSFNLLFFGDFSKLSYDQFEDEMQKVLNDKNLTYQAMVREVYTMGVFLAKKKYRFIRMAYASFILGLLASGGALAVVTFL